VAPGLSFQLRKREVTENAGFKAELGLAGLCCESRLDSRQKIMLSKVQVMLNFGIP
jgi:hypothetical protein